MDRIPVLCVDDEPRVLGGLALQLRRRYDVTVAHTGSEGLDLLHRKGPFVIVMSDMRMPGMDGATFLTHVRQQAPDTMRIVLTGQADLPSAIAAVNDGQVFRFLTKPCPPDALRQAFDAAAEQHRLVTSERVLLERTLHGSVKTLVDVLALVSPVAFGRAQRLKRLTGAMANHLDLPDRWQIEVAAMLSQLGMVSLPEDVVARAEAGVVLADDERAMVRRAAAVTDDLLANIPRLEPVRAMLAAARRRRDPLELVTEDLVPIERGAQVLRAAAMADTMDSRGERPEAILDTLRNPPGAFDTDVLAALGAVLGEEVTRGDGILEIPRSAVVPGMVLAADVRLNTGVLIVARGYEITASFVERLRNYPPGVVVEPLEVRAGSAPDPFSAM